MTIAILDLSNYPPALMPGEPKFGEVLRRWLAQGLEHPMDVIDVQGGAALPSVDAYDGFVVSGSEKGVYDDAWWMDGLRDLVFAARDQGKPLLGICFGHQFFAHVFGGHAEKSDRGKHCGVRWFDLNGERVPAHVWHQDQVVRQPPEARVIASADYCPIAGLAYDFPALSVQFHPEYNRGYLGRFLDRGRGTLLAEDETDRVLAELAATDVAVDLWAEEAGRFLREHLPVPQTAQA